jgi:hypothetical protein
MMMVYCGVTTVLKLCSKNDVQKCLQEMQRSLECVCEVTRRVCTLKVTTLTLSSVVHHVFYKTRLVV